MKNSKKRGFTIVELVIVIAVIAILAGVLIPTFTSVIKKANEASDTALIKSLNTSLKTDEILASKPATMHDALQVVKNDGYDLTKIKATASGNEILWDSVNNCFVYLKDGQVTYIPDSYDKAQDGVALWKIADSKSSISATYSNYLAYAENGALEVSTGIDVGSNSAVAAITYKGETTGKSVVIRTNGGKLTVDAANDHVEHYGIAREVEVANVSESTYVEHGTVAKMTVAAGAKNVVIKSTAVVVEVANSSASLNNEGGYIMSLTGTELKSGAVTTGDEIAVGNYDQLQGLALSSTLGNNLDGKTIKLTADIDMTGKTWTPFGFRTTTGSENAFSGTIDGQGHKIVGLSNGNYKGVESKNSWTEITGDVYGFIAYTKGSVVVKNITFADVDINSSTASVCGVVIGDTDKHEIAKNKYESVTTSLTLENIKVTGSVVAKDKAAGLVGYLEHVANAKISNCVVEATVSATASEKESYRAGGLFGMVSTAKVSVENCSYKGTVTANTVNGSSWCGLLASGFAGDVNMTVKGSTFAGSATTTFTETTNRYLGCTLNGQYVIGTLQASKVVGTKALTSGTFSIEYTAAVPGVGAYYTITQGK